MLPTSIPIISAEFDQNLLFFEFFTPDVKLELIFMTYKALINLILLLVILAISMPNVYFYCLSFCKVSQQAVYEAFFTSCDSSHVNIELFGW